MNTYSSMGEAEGAAMAHNARMAADLQAVIGGRRAADKRDPFEGHFVHCYIREGAHCSCGNTDVTRQKAAMDVPLSDTELAEIRNLGFLDGAITEFDRSSAAVAATRTLLREVDRLRTELAEYERTVAYFDEQSKRRKTERDEARAQVLAASTVKCWTNEDGRRFVFAEDLAFALGYTPTTSRES